MHFLKLFSVSAAVLLFSSGAFAADLSSTSITIPVGDWLSTLAGPLVQVIGALAGLALARLLVILPAPIVGLLKTLHVEQLLSRAVDYGINAVAGAEKGRTLTVSVGNQVAAQALSYAITQGPGWLQGWVGGPDALAKMIVARLPLEASASAGVVTTAG